MALVECEDCGKQVSDASSRCRHCGRMPPTDAELRDDERWMRMLSERVGEVAVPWDEVNEEDRPCTRQRGPSMPSYRPNLVRRPFGN